MLTLACVAHALLTGGAARLPHANIMSEDVVKTVMEVAEVLLSGRGPRVTSPERVEAYLKGSNIDGNLNEVSSLT